MPKMKTKESIQIFLFFSKLAKYLEPSSRNKFVEKQVLQVYIDYLEISIVRKAFQLPTDYFRPAFNFELEFARNYREQRFCLEKFFIFLLFRKISIPNIMATKYDINFVRKRK